MGWTPLVLDDFVFDEGRLESPESFGDIGGIQSLEQHDFPGGIRTQKAYGYFPAAQKWKARFHGTDASDRAEQVKRVLAAGQEVLLQFAERAWLGRVHRFSPTIRHSWLYEYELEFWPRVDYGTPGPPQPPPDDYGTILDLHLLSLNAEIQGTLLNPAFAIVALAIEGPVAIYTGLIQTTLVLYGGVIANLTAIALAPITAAANVALAAIDPFLNLVDATLSSPAADAAARILAIQQILATTSNPVLAVVQTINPNLPVLASQYYGDATRWQTIATANGLFDPQPIGSYSLTIPTA